MKSRVVVLDAGTGNVYSAVRALERVGATVTLTSDYDAVMAADGLVVPGVGAFGSVMQKLRAVRADRMIERRVAGGQAVFGICVGLQVLFEYSAEHASQAPMLGCCDVDGLRAEAGARDDSLISVRESIRAWEGLGEWPGFVDLLPADVVPHMGWSPVWASPDSKILRGLDGERFYFVHSFAVQSDPAAQIAADSRFSCVVPAVSWAEHGARFVAAIEQGPLSAVQFHPEKSGDAGAELLKNWLGSL